MLASGDPIVADGSYSGRALFLLTMHLIGLLEGFWEPGIVRLFSAVEDIVDCRILFNLYS